MARAFEHSVFNEIHTMISEKISDRAVDLIFCSWREKPIQITVQHGGHGKVGAPHEIFVPFRPISQMY